MWTCDHCEEAAETYASSDPPEGWLYYEATPADIRVWCSDDCASQDSEGQS